MPGVVGDNVNFDRGLLWLLHTELHWPDWCQDGRVSLWSRSKVLGRLLFPSFWRRSRHGLTVSCCLPVTLRYIWACKAVNHFQLPAWQMDGANDNGHKTICITCTMALRSFMQVTASDHQNSVHLTDHNHLEFLDENYPTKTKVMGLPYGENFMILTSTVFLWSTRLTDSWTDGR